MTLHTLLPALLLPAKLLEELARRARLPAVVGTILAGTLLGPAALGVIPSEARDPEAHEVVQALAQIGLCVLLFRIGLDTRLEAFRSVWRSATIVAAVGIGLPLLLGWAVGRAWGWSDPSALFLGATLTTTSIREDSPMGHLLSGSTPDIAFIRTYASTRVGIAIDSRRESGIGGRRQFRRSLKWSRAWQAPSYERDRPARPAGGLPGRPLGPRCVLRS